MTSSPEAIALAYLDAVAAKDLDRVEALLHPEVQFVSPVSKLSSARELIPSFRRIGAIHVRNDIKRVFSDGNEVCVIYDFVTDVVGAVPTVEW
ncbi:MAG TPA: nuclear transport factor 2 family protein, partial [Kofleriaceae bacterium]|nr:nuclear transport factor 2 family protein [Kofleriaceae bacterium]